VRLDVAVWLRGWHGVLVSEASRGARNWTPCMHTQTIAPATYPVCCGRTAGVW
jgi:hypothetical protein